MYRSPVKRQYAEAYAKWVRNGRRGPEPQRPATLSYMAAQAVRLAVAS